MNTNRATGNFRGRRASVRRAALLFLLIGLPLLLPASEALGQKQRRPTTRAARGRVPEAVHLRILRVEDERRWDAELSTLLSDKDARIRRRAALAAGRIGDERAVPQLLSLLQNETNPDVREMAVFGLGEIESAAGADALMAIVQRADQTSEIRARAVEALGNIAAALPKTDEARAHLLGDAILKALASEAGQGPKRDREVVLAALTAALRASPQTAGAAVARFLSDTDARVRADAANALARLRAKDGAERLRALLANDPDAVVRANAARALGVAEDRASFDALMARSLTDADERVRVSALRALGTLADARAAGPLLERAAALFAAYRTAKTGATSHPREINELLEIATVLGRILAASWDVRAVNWLREFRETEARGAPEIEIALARIAPALYVREKPLDKLSDAGVRAETLGDWRQVSSLAQGLGELSGIKTEVAGSAAISLQGDAQVILRSFLDDKGLPPLAAPDVLRAFATFKANDASEVLRKQLKSPDVIMRATAAELLGELPPEQPNARALTESLPVAMHDEVNDATLALLDALAKQRTAEANEAIKKALDSTDHIVRRRAVALLKANAAGDFSSRTGTVATRNTEADYRRALARAGKRVNATVTLDKGSFVIELLAEDAPLTVDNFVQLANRGYFNGVAFHRVVPNFVIQDGDPRGDGNGGPGYQIRCEINEVPYERGAVGMALSGKDTGGSQWFVTHSPQPHLDGGYTVFGRVISGMEVVDRVARGDIIRRVHVTDGAPPASKAVKPAKTTVKPTASGTKKSGVEQRVPGGGGKRRP